jgi:hypothetical protein
MYRKPAKNLSTTHHPQFDVAVVPVITVVMTKQRPLQRLLLQRRRHSKTRTFAAPQCFKPHSHLNHEDNASILIEDDVAVDKDPLLSSQYTVFYTVKLNEKTVKKDSKVYQIDKEIKSFV